MLEAVWILVCGAVLPTMLILDSYVFKTLVVKPISHREALKWASIVRAMNRLIITGSGYTTLILWMKRGGAELGTTVNTVILWEGLSIGPWILMATYFGGRLAPRIPLHVLLGLALVLVFFLFVKKRQISAFACSLLEANKQLGLRPVFVVPIILVEILLSLVYYYSIIRFVGCHLSPYNILRVASLSVTTGYLSPIPSGLGIREGVMAFLLIEHGFTLEKAILVGLVDRVVATAFFLFAGMCAGSKIIIETIRNSREKLGVVSRVLQRR